MDGYDSRPATWEHIDRVRQLLGEIVADFSLRADVHDRSKLEEPEKSMYDEFTPKLRDSTYGSDEYRSFLEAMGPALQHHYEKNPHHPEHHPDGIHGMNLLELLEMLADWKAATERHADGSLDRSISQNRERFGYGDEIEGLLRRTAGFLDWL